MKMKYEKPALDIVILNIRDVITVSEILDSSKFIIGENLIKISSLNTAKTINY